jgi:hypothetical protein
MILFEPGFSGTEFPLEHPRIGAHAISGTVAASTEAAGFSAIFAANLNTTQWWRPTAVPATWDLTFTSATVSYFGIAAHDLFTVGATLEVQRWDGAAWVTIITHTPTDNSVIFGLLIRTSRDRMRFRFTGGIPTIGVISMGDVIEFPQRCQYTGSTSFELANQDEYRDTLSEGGQVLDRFRTRRSIPARMEVSHLSEAWSDSVLTLLRTYAKDWPIFMADRPASRPKSVVFGLTKAPIQPERTIPQHRVAMSVTIEVMGNVSA